MKEKMLDKMGLWLSVIFEHKALYYMLNAFFLAIFVVLRMLSSYYYGLQLDVIVASKYQVYTIICDLFSMITVFTWFSIAIERERYLK